MSDFKPIRGNLIDAKSTLTHDKTCSLNVGHGSRICDCHMAVIAHSNQRIAELEEQNKWISVDERLPETKDWPVLLCNIHGTVMEWFAYAFDDGESGDCDPSFWDANDVDWLDLKYAKCWKPVNPPERIRENSDDSQGER